MIELDANGQIPKLTKCRIYIVAGFSGNQPFSGLNIWGNDGPYDQSFIESYDTFRGWATETLSIDQLVENTRPPRKPGEFRVALVKGYRTQDAVSAELDPCGGGYIREDSEDFLGWLTPTLTVDLPQPVRKSLVRFRWQAPEGLVEGLFTTTQEAWRAALGRRANFGKVFGLQHDLEVVLEPQHFLGLTDNQEHIASIVKPGRPSTVCGFNPLEHLV